MRPSRRIYLKTTPFPEALRRWNAYISGLPRIQEEEVEVTESLGRITSRPVVALSSNPFYTSSAMDGYAVRFEDTIGATEVNPKRLRLGKEAVEVNTGDPLPEGYNAVVMVEDVTREDPFILIYSPVGPYQNVRAVGEDIVESELILPESHRIRPVDIGAMIGGGVRRVWVRRRPVVGLIPTGGEVVEPSEGPQMGKIVDFNSYMLGAMMTEWGCVYKRRRPVEDLPHLLEEAILDILPTVDVVAVIAGSSAGKRDVTPEVVERLGEVILHGIGMRPGKPVLLARVKDKPLIGVPGYPVSAFIVAEYLLKPLIFHLLGLDIEEPEVLHAKMSRPVSSPLGQMEFLRVKVGLVKDTFVATPVGRGAGALMTVQRADGIVEIPEASEGIGQGVTVPVRLLRSKREIEDTVVCIGSHDNCLDLLANFLRKRYPRYSLSSAHVGSMGGLIAIKRGETHIAGTHLLDEETGEYNVPFIKRLLADLPLKVFNLHYRLQGFMVKRGNPKGIKGVEDLKRNDIIFINRQRGSGTRLLTDKILRDAGISATEVRGYDREEYTHMGVASQVASGTADVGIGILTAARALGLDFIPVAKERYDIVVPEYALNQDNVMALLDIIKGDDEFKRAVEELGGYDTSEMGRLVYEQ